MDEFNYDKPFEDSSNIRFFTIEIHQTENQAFVITSLRTLPYAPSYLFHLFRLSALWIFFKERKLTKFMLPERMKTKFIEQIQSNYLMKIATTNFSNKLMKIKFFLPSLSLTPFASADNNKLRNWIMCSKCRAPTQAQSGRIYRKSFQANWINCFLVLLSLSLTLCLFCTRNNS